MNQATYTEKMTCKNCKLVIKSGSDCYLADLPGEVVACSKSCARILETRYKLGLKDG